MKIPVSSQPWQPLTLGGVAGFGRASLGRLFKVQTAVALLLAASVIWFLAGACFPQVDQAVAALPDQCGIRNRRLSWAGASPVVLAEGPFLAITVNLEGGETLARGVDLQFELGREELRIRSLLGYFPMRYPAGWTLTLDRLETQAWWGAWRGFLLLGAGAATVAGLFASWCVIALVYSFPVRTIAFYADRQVSGWGSWKVASAALLPGTVLMAAALGLYRFHRLNLIALLFAWLIHWGVGWIYVGLAPLRLPRTPGAQAVKRNPFGEAKRPKPEGD
jgi:hypothetical protein